MRRTRSLFLFVMVALLAPLLAGCTGPKQQINASAIDGMLQPVCDRHDAYVTRDDKLTPSEREMYLRSSMELRAIQNAAMQRTPPAPRTR